MGYKSNVAISMSKENYEVLKEFDKENNNLRELLDIAEVKESDNIVVLHWDWLKWYPHYPEVQAIEEFLAYMSDQDEPYRFIRIGEDIEDVEIETNYGKDYNYHVTDAIDIYRDIDINI